MNQPSDLPPFRLLRLVLPAVALLAAAALPGPARAQDPYDQALARYRAYLERPSLYKRTLGREVLAATLDPRALEVLVRSYDKPEEPKNAVRHLLATIVMSAFGKTADPATLAAWRARYADAEHAWLWFETMRPSAESELDPLRSLVLGRTDPFLRSAALEALAERAAKVGIGAEGAGLCLELLAAPPKKDLERALLLESVASLCLANRKRLRDEPWRPVAELLIRNLDEADTPLRSKVVITRHLAKAFESPNLGLDAHWWLNELDRKPRPKATGGQTVTVPFFTLRTTGYRFAYVIDASDSMLKRVTDREKRDLGPTTGDRSKPKDAGPGFVPTEADIDWSRVVTRFDAAREYLRLSLSSLSEEHEFIVLLFGDEPQPLASTPKLVAANRRTIRAAIAELDKVEAGPPTERRPDGQLFGQTNLHAGIAAAFQVTRSGTTRRQEYVDPKGMLEGCDTIFVLSDGAPSWDDYAEKDARDPEDQAGDPETGAKYANVPTLIFQGPYARPPYDFLVADVRRMNLFRKAEIHCVGIGEANHDLLRQIATIGLGQALKVEGERR
jgi:hypothetical protein